MNRSSAFTNSCIKVPVDPKSKMPKTASERINNLKLEQCFIDSSTTCSVSTADENTEKLKDFYRSIPDYNEINHLSSSEFYLTLRSLREKKKFVLGLTVEDINESLLYDNKKLPDYEKDNISLNKHSITHVDNENKNFKLKSGKVSNRKKPIKIKEDDVNIQFLKEPSQIVANNDKLQEDRFKLNPAIQSDVNIKKVKVKGGSKRNDSACSISWHDDKIELNKNDVDKKFEKFFQIRQLVPSDSTEFRSQSMPSSPLRTKYLGASNNKSKRKNVTIPNPFKMSERYLFTYIHKFIFTKKRY